MSNPLISIIIPTFNRAEMVSKTIDSVRSQILEDWELIVVDDASTDETEAVIRNYMHHDSRVRYIQHKTNKGGSAARNEGIKNSKGNYIALLDDDDRWHPEKLKLQFHNMCIFPEAGLIYCGFRYMDCSNNGVIKNIFPCHRGDVSSILIRNNILGSPTPLIRKECFKSVGLFDEELTSCQDWDMWIRISQHYKFNYVDKILADVTLHGQQISANLVSKIESRKNLIRKYNDVLKRNPAILAYHYKKLAILYAFDHNSAKVRKYLCHAISLQPGNIRYLLHLFLSMFPPAHRLFISCFGSLLQHDGVAFYH